MATPLENIIEGEGYRKDPYTLEYTTDGKKVTEDFYTGGFGHKMSDKDIEEFNYNWTDDQKLSYWTRKLEEDYSRAKVNALEEVGDMDVTPEQLEIITELKYNMGSNSFTKEKWPSFFNALSSQDLEEASRQLLLSSDGKSESKYAKQVKGRAYKIAERLRNSGKTE